MNAIDVLLGVVLLIAMWAGYRRGFIAGVVQLLVLFLGVLVALLGYRFGARLLVAHAPALGVWISPLSFVATWLIAHLVLSALGAKLLRAVPRRVQVHRLNRALGVFPGIAGGLINISLLSILLLTVPLADGASTLTRESKLASRLSTPTEWLDCRLAPIFDPALQRTLQALTVSPESRERLALPFTTNTAQVRPALESELLELVNADRFRHGLRPLQADPELAEVARAHCRDMLARGYFAHVSPDGNDLADRVRSANVHYLIVGENLALAPTLPAAHQGLMNSPGHRANLLREQFTRVGIGVLDAGRHGLMVTQNFRN